jgi:hypothetical protein
VDTVLFLLVLFEVLFEAQRQATGKFLWIIVVFAVLYLCSLFVVVAVFRKMQTLICDEVWPPTDPRWVRMKKGQIGQKSVVAQALALQEETKAKQMKLAEEHGPVIGHTANRGADDQQYVNVHADAFSRDVEA